MGKSAVTSIGVAAATGDVNHSERSAVARCHLEALDGTPILDVKPVLNGDISQR
jgi:tRNA (Thr-GGU) A37 N-methylase